MGLSKEFEFYRGKLVIDDTNINKELGEYSSYYFSVLQIANSCEENYDKTEALTDATVREAAKTAEEKITEKVVESRVKQDPAFQKADQERNTARALKDAYKAKGNMLIQMATNMREEMKNLNHGVNADTTSYAQYL